MASTATSVNPSDVFLWTDDTKHYLMQCWHTLRATNEAGDRLNRVKLSTQLKKLFRARYPECKYAGTTLYNRARDIENDRPVPICKHARKPFWNTETEGFLIECVKQAHQDNARDIRLGLLAGKRGRPSSFRKILISLFSPRYPHVSECSILNRVSHLRKLKRINVDDDDNDDDDGLQKQQPSVDVVSVPSANDCPSTGKNVHDFRIGDGDNNSSSDKSDVSKKIYLDTTMTKDWSRQAVISLIDLYKENSVLYDCKHPAYHNKISRKQALDIISRELSLGIRPGTTPDDVTAELANLQTQFAAEQHQIATYEKTENTDTEPYKPALWWYDRMMFVKDYIVPRNESPSSSSANNVSVKEEVLEVGENDIKRVLLPSDTHEEMDESNDSSIPQQQPRLEKNAEQIFGDFISSTVGQIVDLRTRNKLKIQIMKAISDAQAEDDKNFGNYVTSSLLKIKSTNVKANAKSQITQILCDAQMEDTRN